MMAKKIAILVRDRKHEALRMAIGATLSNDVVNVFIMDDILEMDEEIDTNLQMLSDLNVEIFSNNKFENDFGENKMTTRFFVYISFADFAIPNRGTSSRGITESQENHSPLQASNRAAVQEWLHRNPTSAARQPPSRDRRAHRSCATQADSP